MSVFSNLRTNSWPIVTILLFSTVTISLIYKDWIFADNSVSNEPNKITIGFFKEKKTAYFDGLKSRLQKSLQNENFKVTIDESSNDINQLCDKLKAGDIDIAGEFSPLDFVLKHDECQIEPLIGIEYDNSPYYRSLLVVRKGPPETCSLEFKSGYSNILEKIKQNIDKNTRNCVIAYSGDKTSTSGYYYPQSYFIEHGILSKSILPLGSDAESYKAVMDTREEGNGTKEIVASFVADYIYKSNSKKYTEGEEPTIIVDATDPIPNGIFAIRKELGDDPKFRKEVLLSVWKSVRGVEVGIKKSKITGWRSGISLVKDIDLVKHHKYRVDFKEELGKNHSKIVSIVIIVIVIILIMSSYVFIGRSGSR